MLVRLVSVGAHRQKVTLVSCYLRVLLRLGFFFNLTDVQVGQLDVSTSVTCRFYLIVLLDVLNSVFERNLFVVFFDRVPVWSGGTKDVRVVRSFFILLIAVSHLRFKDVILRCGNFQGRLFLKLLLDLLLNLLSSNFLRNFGWPSRLIVLIGLSYFMSA